MMLCFCKKLRSDRLISIGVRAGRWGREATAAQLRKLRNFPGKKNMIRVTTLNRKHYKVIDHKVSTI